MIKTMQCIELKDEKIKVIIDRVEFKEKIFDLEHLNEAAIFRDEIAKTSFYRNNLTDSKFIIHYISKDFDLNLKKYNDSYLRIIKNKIEEEIIKTLDQIVCYEKDIDYFLKEKNPDPKKIFQFKYKIKSFKNFSKIIDLKEEPEKRPGTLKKDQHRHVYRLDVEILDKIDTLSKLLNVKKNIIINDAIHYGYTCIRKESTKVNSKAVNISLEDRVFEILKNTSKQNGIKITEAIEECMKLYYKFKMEEKK